jgi:hypothetical protein
MAPPRGVAATAVKSLDTEARYLVDEPVAFAFCVHKLARHDAGLRLITYESHDLDGKLHA